MSKAKNLDRYREKRDFDRTPEPKGRKKASRDEAPIFVIQKHESKTSHYDFRLQVGDALKSWAVPKGPSTDPREKRLAVPTEDHPLEYANFEGVIPEDEYGAGVVLVWDTGDYRNIKKTDGKEVPMSQCVEDGHIEIWLEGKKLSGGYALHRTSGQKNERWILVKMRDKKADARRNPVSTQPESVLSGRTAEEIAEEHG